MYLYSGNYVPEVKYRHHQHHQQQLAWGAAHPSILVYSHKACPAFKIVCHYFNKVDHCQEMPILTKHKHQPHPPQRTFTTHDQILPESKPSSIRSPWILSYNITEPAPTINVHVSALNAVQTALPDSGEDISVVGPDTITMLQQLAAIRCGTQGSHGSLDDTNRPTSYP